MLADLLNQPVTILAETSSNAIDEYGNEQPAITPNTTNGYLQQQSRMTAEGYVAVESWLLILPPGTIIQAGDEVTVGPQQFVVDGDPGPVWNPVARATDHIEATLKRAGGGLEQ
jgi:hypothetical protein